MSSDNACFPIYVSSTLASAVACWHKSETETAQPLAAHSALLLPRCLPACIDSSPAHLQLRTATELLLSPLSACDCISARGCISAGCDHLRSHTRRGQDAEQQTLPKPRGAAGVSSDKPVATGWPLCLSRMQRRAVLLICLWWEQKATPCCY